MPVNGSGAAANEALRRVVADAKGADPLAPVTVLVPTNLAGVLARRSLAGGVNGRPGIAGLAVLTVDPWNGEVSPFDRAVEQCLQHLATDLQHPKKGRDRHPQGKPLSHDAVQRLVAKHATIAAASCPSLGDKHVTPHTSHCGKRLRQAAPLPPEPASVIAKTSGP